MPGTIISSNTISFLTIREVRVTGTMSKEFVRPFNVVFDRYT